MTGNLFPTPAPQAPQNRSIVVVEDERIAAEDLRRRLESWGYTVPAVVASGEEAVATAERTRPDLLLMDIKLKGKIDGVEAARRIKAQNDIPVIYATSYTDPATMQRAQATDPLGVITKPYDDHEMRSAIENALFKRGMERQMEEVQERLRRLLARTADLVLLRRHGVIVAANPATLAVLGYALDEIVQRDLPDLVVQDDRDAVARAIAAAQGGERPCGITIRLQGRSGSTFSVLLSIEQLQQGSEPAQQMVMTNLSDRLSAEQDASTLSDDLFNARAEAEEMRRTVHQQSVELDHVRTSLESALEERNGFALRLEKDLGTPTGSLQGLVALLEESGLRPDQYRYVEEMRRVIEELRSLHLRFLDAPHEPASVVTLPAPSRLRSSGSPQHERGVESAPKTPHPLRVLVADDESINRTIAQRMLESLGCDVEAVADGTEAVAAAEGRPFDMIFLDCCMPGMDGYAAAARMRRTLAPASVPRIIAMSASLDAADRGRCLGAGMDDFLPKPMTVDHLRTVLQKWGNSPA